MNHAMNPATHQSRNSAGHGFQTEIFRAVPLPVIEHDDDQLAATHADEDWAEFLSLGLQADPAEFGVHTGDWQRSPVLLSY